MVRCVWEMGIAGLGFIGNIQGSISLVSGFIA